MDKESSGIRRYAKMLRQILVLTIASVAHPQTYYYPSRTIIRPKGYIPPPQPSHSHRRSFAVVAPSKPVMLDAQRPLPCCKDESGGAICRSMKQNDPKNFAHKCANEPDFSLIVCCKACDDLGENYRERASSFFSAANNSTHCFDRMSQTYCSKFQTSTDAWSTKRWSCHSEHNRLAFRVCRATCGFCNLDWRVAPESSKCN